MIEASRRRLYAAHGGRDPEPGLPSIVLLHGAGMDHTVWVMQSRYLAHHGWNVYALDLPGHGRSDGPGSTTLEGYRVAVVDALNDFGIGNATVVGHSMGGAIAQLVAATAPERARALVLIGTGTRMRVSPDLIALTRDEPKAAGDLIASWAYGRPSHFGRCQASGLWLTGGGQALLRRCQPAVLHADFAACDAFDGRAGAAGIACPALVVTGGADIMTPPRLGRALAEALPNGRYVEIPDAGHMVMVETPDALIRVLDEFLRSVRV